MRTGLAVLASVLAFAATAAAEPGAWRVEGQPGGSLYRLSLDGRGPNVTYAFECRPDGVLITETGVTQLTDIQTGKKVGDDPGSSITSGAAFLALMSDPKASPDLLPAKATPNPARGWDLSVVVPKTDKQWRALPRAKMMTLMTTGWTVGVKLDDAARKVIAGFVAGCGS
jgi:hypothetical protein